MRRIVGPSPGANQECFSNANERPCILDVHDLSSEADLYGSKPFDGKTVLLSGGRESSRHETPSRDDLSCVKGFAPRA